eukprot:186136-Chlamydomonas_euryale.AAC.11
MQPAAAGCPHCRPTWPTCSGQLSVDLSAAVARRFGTACCHAAPAAGLSRAAAPRRSMSIGTAARGKLARHRAGAFGALPVISVATVVIAAAAAAIIGTMAACGTRPSSPVWTA